jgi:hydroxyacylglutathione hydrolase
MIGLDGVTGYFATDAVDAWPAAQGELESTDQVSVKTLAERIHDGDVQVIDVRSATEYDAGHLPDVTHIPLGSLPDRLKELSPDIPTVVHCQGGGRSAIAASILKANGFTDVANLTGGFGEWEKEGLPVKQG